MGEGRQPVAVSFLLGRSVGSLVAPSYVSLERSSDNGEWNRKGGNTIGTAARSLALARPRPRPLSQRRRMEHQRENGRARGREGADRKTDGRQRTDGRTDGRRGGPGGRREGGGARARTVRHSAAPRPSHRPLEFAVPRQRKKEGRSKGMPSTAHLNSNFVFVHIA